MQPTIDKYSIIERYMSKTRDFKSSQELRRNSRKSDRKRKGKRKYGF